MKKQVFVNEEELNRWEEEQLNIALDIFAMKSTKMKDPQLKTKKRESRQKKQKWNSFGKEDKPYRKMYQKTFRARWKLERSQGRYHIPRNREYKTYGYLTW